MATKKKKTSKTKSSGPDYKKVAIVYRPDKPEAFEHAQKVAAWLSDRKIVVYTQPHQKLSKNEKVLTTEKSINDLDLVVVLGGDGTYLNAVRMLNGRQIPVLGINMGSLGFLTNTKLEELFEAIVYTLNGKMETRPRAMFEVEHRPIKGKAKKFLALNDVVVERGALAQLITISFQYEDFLVSELKADGVVVATPTGSTAYNLAAGGPILHPEVNCMVVTPISPHSLTQRPMIFSDHRPLKFKITNPTQKAILTVDGELVCELKPNEDVIVSRHENDHLILRHPTHSYFGLLREKLKFGERD